MIQPIKRVPAVADRKSSKHSDIPSPRASCGFGYCYIPEGLDREKFIQTCLRTSTITVFTEDNQIINNVPIGKLGLQYLEFPNESRILGSPVFWNNIKQSDQMVVVEVYNALDEFIDMTESSFNFQRITNSGVVRLTGKGDNGELFISVDSYSSNQPVDGTDYEKTLGGKIHIDVRNENHTGEVNLKVDGNINIKTTGKTKVLNSKELEFEVRDPETDKDNNLEGIKTSLKVINGELVFKISEFDKKTGEDIKDGELTSLSYSRKSGLNYIDEFKNQIISNGDLVKIISKKFSLNEGEESMVLGNMLTSFLSDFLDELSKSTTATLAGVQPLINASLLAAFKKKLPDLLSKHGFLTKEDSRTKE